MLDLAKYDENDWDWWEDTVECWSISKLVKMLFKWNINSWFIDEIPDTL